MKDFVIGIKAIISFMSFLMTAIGAVGYLVYDHHYLFAVTTVIVCVFAFRPMYKAIKIK